MNTRTSLYISFIILALFNPAMANGNSHKTMAGDDAHEHESSHRPATESHRQESLEEEVARLHAIVDRLLALQPTITMLMPNLAERFHVMHHAGETADWAIASHELEGMKQLLERIKLVDPAMGTMAEGFMGPGFERLGEAIEHGNMKAFESSLKQAVDSCNACHVAAGSPSMKVVLDAKNSISIRHPHAFGKSKMPMGHTH